MNRDTAADEGRVTGGTRLAIIRHGEAWCNAEQFIGGPKSCRGLTPRGVRQAEVLAQRLARTHEFDRASAVWTSDLPRAIETAAIIAIGLQTGEVCRSPALSERDAGEADGMFWCDIPERYGRTSTPGDNPNLPLSPGGETWIDFIDRGARELTRLALSHPSELIVVVAHGGIIDSSLIRFLQLPEHGSMIRLHAEHTSITEWQHTGKKWRLVRYNDFAHLSEPEYAGDLLAPPPVWVHTEAN